ncbi:MAG: RNA-guided pseudouridylation complex pseudouridine synthase subunit Cbf5 [Nanoarchaeota archaeon]|nr:RNA-guided pseudouridylation complex pseudouridine synthase subunit Cbf5 [Nanoarchaeota archaeon]
MSKLPFERGAREVFIRKEMKTDPKFGCKPGKRPVDELINYGVININKPKGPTSHQVSAYAQKILGIKKAGHSGTLDPKVTGVLPIALGKATRIVQTLLPSGKEYVCIMHIHHEVPEKKIRETAAKFVGKIKQLPPIKSAIKRQWRYRKIYYLNIMEIKGQDVLFRIGCQAGTYIRKICHDMGVELGCGAHMAELIRTKAGPFNDQEMYTLQDVTDAYWYYQNEKEEKFIRKVIKPIEFAISHLPKVWVFDTTVDTICHGAALKVPGISKVEGDIQVDDMMAIMTLKDELIAIGTTKMISKDMVKKEKGIAIKINKVFMDRSLYPKVPKKE